MKQPEAGREWAQQWTASVGKTLQDTRTSPDRRMSAQQVSDRCAELGYPIPRSTITNMENGRRETVSIQEIVILARAVGISPLTLILPIGRDRTVETLPGAAIPTWLAAQWLTGEGPFPEALDDGGWGAATDDMRAWKAGAPMHFRQMAELIEQRKRNVDAAHVARIEARNAEASDERAAHLQNAESLEERARRVEEHLALRRQLMRRDGLDPGELPANLSHLDEDDRG